MAQTSIHEFTVESLDGGTINFADFKGKKIMVVNTVSKCGFTPQYMDLQELHQQHPDDLVIVGFPANNYGAQEPGTNTQIAEFCQQNYGVSFPMAAKVSVDGDDMHPLFAWLTAQPNPDFDGRIKWNFEKFLLDENGKLVHRWRSTANPTGKKIAEAL